MWGAYGVLAGLFLGSRSYWATRREQRTVAPCAIGSLALFFFFQNTSFCSAVFIHIRGLSWVLLAHVDGVI